MNKKTVSLVLGSGGARGLAHIGVIHWLEAHGYEIKAISGCSIGSLIGGVYAAGKLDVLEAWMRAITRPVLASYLDFAWKRDGIIKGDKVINTLVSLIGDQLIEDLPMPYTAVSFDLYGEKEVWIQSGKLFDAIRASSSLPLVMTPFEDNGTVLIDGGILNPVPIAPVFSEQTDLIIAVNLGGPFQAFDKPKQKSEKSNPITSTLSEQIKQFFQSIQSLAPINVERGISPYEIYYQSFEAMQSTIARLKLAAYPPDKTVDIPRNACGTMEFYRAAEMIEFGYQMAQKFLDDI
ncbi:MAG: serine protease [Chloroflexi bacterium]|nr:MAG: serine protease [Chloroflexota bacterium]